MKHIAIAAGLTTANFLWQWSICDIADYRVAFERSFFQAVAVAVTYLLCTPA
jgi:hypothetical protein